MYEFIHVKLLEQCLAYREGSVNANRYARQHGIVIKKTRCGSLLSFPGYAPHIQKDVKRCFDVSRDIELLDYQWASLGLHLLQRI